MKFSVLISVYKNDNSDYFKKALESITVEQTKKPAQVVVVEDGPVSEKINEIINDLSQIEKEIEFSVIEKPENEGLAAALNNGIDVCKHEWIARMDSDDISAPNRFEKQVLFIEKNPQIDIVGGAISEFNEHPGDLKSVRHVGLTQDDIIKMACSRTPMNHVSVMYKKSMVIKSGKYSENFGKLEDYKLWVDMISKKANMANLDDVLVYVRVGNGFISRRSNKREIQDWDMLQNYLKKAGIITSLTGLKNKMYIRCFIYMPEWMKKLAYKVLLRN